MNAAGRNHRPHDLLWLADAAALSFDGPAPRWATLAWLTAAPAVVRRCVPTHARHVPVGLRGATRSERCAAQMSVDSIVRKFTPEALARRVATDPVLRASPLPCLRSLAALAPALDELPLCWGVTGSVGFTLASGFDMLRPDSDLDLLVRAPSAGDAHALRAVATLTCKAESRIDVQVETPFGAFVLTEWLRTGGPVLLKTAHGPVLCDDAWQASGDESRLSAAPRTAAV